MLRNENIAQLGDVRRFPGSKKWSHFNKEKFKELLENRSIAYSHMEDPGGRRKMDQAEKLNFTIEDVCSDSFLNHVKSYH